MIGKKEISLYFHIPFCTKKCAYCHFYVVPDKEESKKELLEGLQIEWSHYLPLLKECSIVSVYFGGGTPSLFGPERIKTVLEWIKTSANLAENAEITLEANPENIHTDLIKAYHAAGINRLSIGIQSFDRALLQLLGRNHPPETALEAVINAHDGGIHNLSIDLMYDLPQQSLADWEHTLDKVKTLPITHLSLYNLTIEPHTLFFKKKKELVPLLPNEEISLAMYQMAIDKIESMGLQQYEISAFAKPGYESLHNSGYWIGRPFLGFGPSAFSFWEGKRFQNVPHLKKYCDALKKGESPIHFEEALDLEALRRELFVIQLRLRKGVYLKKFSEEQGELNQTTLDQLHSLSLQGLIQWEGDLVSLSKKGVLFYDTIASELI